MFNIFKRLFIKDSDIIKNELDRYLKRETDTFIICYTLGLKYNPRGKIRYTLQNFRLKRKKSYYEINGDLKREYLLNSMIRYFKNLIMMNGKKIS